MQSFSDFLDTISSEFTPVVKGFDRHDYAAIDLSANNRDLLKLEVASSAAFSVYITEFLKNRGKQAAYGGYNELRTLYNRSELFNNTASNRNIHIGLDIWVPEGTEILAPLPSRIHSFQDNDHFGDYGPTIILEHEVTGRKFFTLYGHLSRQSLENLEIGQELQKGSSFATLGDRQENGDYAPHLHFQIMESLEGKAGDYPGVVQREELDFYLKNCPDPNLLLKI